MASWVSLKSTTRVWAFAHALVLLFLWSPPAHAIQFCKVYSWLLPQKRLVSEAKYDEAKKFFADAFHGRKKISRKLVLGKLREKGDGSPETLMALWDTLNPEASVPFAEWMSRLETAGIDVQFRKAGDVDKPTDQHNLKWKWTFSKSLTPVSRKPYLLEIRAPESVPETEEELFNRMYTLSVGLPRAFLDVTARRAPMLSGPIGDGPASYPKELRDAIEAVERRVYDTMKHWEDRWHVKPPVEIDKEGPGAWAGQYWTMPLALLWRAVFPFYDPARGHRPSQKSYGLYKAGLGSEVPEETPLTKWIRDQYQVAGTTKWTADQYLRVLKGLWAYGMGKATIATIQFFANGQWRVVQQAGQNLADGLQDPDLNKRLKAYQDNQDGDPIVNEMFQPQIDALVKQIQETPDPKAREVLEKKLKKVIQDRDDIKN